MPSRPDARRDAPVVGSRMPMIDARDKVTGAGLYTDDITLPGTLVGKVLHSPHPHARIRSIDTSRARALPGVHAVATGADFPNRYGILPIGHDETAFAIDKVRYIGDSVAGVAAVSEDVARMALSLIQVEYEVLTPWFDALKAMEAASDWIHEDKPRNIEKEYHHEFGDLAAGFAEADHIRKDRFVCPEVTHAAMEPHATLASYDGSGQITVWSSTQVPHYLHRTLSNVLSLPMSRVRVIKPLLGGGFGGKSEIIPLEVQASCLSYRACRPVKIVYTREQVFLAHRGRPAQIVDLEMGVKKDGTLTAVAARIVQDGGAYCGYGPVTILYSGALLGAMYDIPNVKFDGYRVLTNKPACGAMRGHGTVNTRFAFESQLDMIAEDIGMDPAEIRLKNQLSPNTRTVNDLRVTSYGYPQCIEQVVEKSGWKEKHGKMPRGRGIGISGSHYVSGAANPIVRSKMPHTTVNLKIDRDAGITLYSGAAEIGQGSDTIQVQLAAETLGVRPERINLIAADTQLTPVDLGSYSSRVTFMAGNACLRAAESMRQQIVEAVAEEWGVSASSILMKHETVSSEEGEARSVSFDEAVAIAIGKRGGLVATGNYTPPEEARGGRFKGAGVGPSPAYSYSAQTVEVTVDTETGQYTVDRVVAAHDCGRALNPLAVEGQVIGSVWMGLGQAQQEEMLYREGRLMNPSTLEYKTASPVESPPIDCIIVETQDPEGPMGAKEAGEGSLAAALPALANAIHDAVGVRITSLPITPEKILAALRKQPKP